MSSLQNGMLERQPKSLWRLSIAWEERRSPPRKTGTPARTAIVGVDMIHLATFLIAHSDSTMDEVAAFIYNEGGALYSNQRISERLKDLAVTKKKASIKAY